MAGANSNSAQKTFAARFSNTHTGTGSINYGIYSQASGGGTNVGGQFVGTTGTDFPGAILKAYTDSIEGVYIGYNTASSYGYMGAAKEGVSYSNFELCPGGGFLGIGIVPSSSWRTRVAGNVRVGSGTGTFAITPDLGVDVNGQVFFEVRNSTAGIESYITNTTSAGITGSFQGTVTNHALVFSTNSLNQGILTNAGLMGIGELTPTATLQLKGQDQQASSAPLKFTYKSLATTAASGTGALATLTFATQSAPPFKVGSKITVTGVTPAGYNSANVTVNACTVSTVVFGNVTTGAQTVAGTITQGDVLVI